MKKILFVTFLILSILALISQAAAIRFPEKPPTENFFVDEANLINPEHRQEINKLALALLKEEKVPILVVTIPSLLSYDAVTYTIESYAQALFDEWGIGFKNRNFGMLLLVSKGDRKARIELGREWDHRHDREAKKVMDDLIIAQFKRSDFSAGIIDGVRGMDAMARGLELPRATSPWWVIPLMLLLLAVAVGTIVSLFKSGRAGWGWALIAALGVLLFFLLRAAASSGGSGGSFGGGSSGGGGASGSW